MKPNTLFNKLADNAFVILLLIYTFIIGALLAVCLTQAQTIKILSPAGDDSVTTNDSLPVETTQKSIQTVVFPQHITINVHISQLGPTEAENEDVAEETVRYGFTEDEIYLMTQLLCGDSSTDGDGEYDFEWFEYYGKKINHQEIAKVLCVVMNRVISDDFPDSVSSVIMQTGQFAVMPRNASSSPGEKTVGIVREWCEAYDTYDNGALVIPETHLYFRSGPNQTNITRESWK